MRALGPAGVLLLACSAACALGQSTGDGRAEAAEGQGSVGPATGGGSTAAPPTGDANGPAVDGNGPLPPGTPNSNTVLPPANPASPYTFVGRTDLTDPNAPVFRFCNSAIGATFSGGQVGVRLSATGDDRWEAVVDGGPPEVLVTHPGNTNVLLPIAQGLAAGDHTIWLTKRTERYQSGGGETCGQTAFLGLELAAGGLLKTPPARRARRILAIGDSSFTGYGAGQTVTGPANECDYAPANQDAQASVPAYLAAKFGAELHNISFSGMGVYSSVYDPTPTNALPYVWQQLAPHNSTPLWDHSRFVPDVVVISGGGDDLDGAPGAGTFANRPAFVATYRDWLRAIRKTAPDALIVAVLPSGASGGDIQTLGGAISEAVTAAADANTIYFWYFAGDAKYSTYGEAAVGLKLYWGCRQHPSAQGAAFLAGRLGQLISSRRGWAAPP